jgi:hypothetical protein
MKSWQKSMFALQYQWGDTFRPVKMEKEDPAVVTAPGRLNFGHNGGLKS